VDDSANKEEPRSEVEILRRLRDRDRAGLIGDDVSFLPPLRRPVVTADQQISGIHFVPDLAPPIVARRLLAVNLSDLAAAGAYPKYGWLVLATPKDYPVEEFLDAFVTAAEAADLILAGGDLASSPTTSASLTLLGELSPSAQELRRSNAQPGDALWLGAPIGHSALGRHLLLEGVRVSLAGDLTTDRAWPGPRVETAKSCIRAHHFPTPQLALGQWLAEQPRASALDLSDGLVLDLHRLTLESQVQAVLELDRLDPAEPILDLARACQLDPVELALFGGEDYVLLFTLPKGTEPPNDFDCRKIGRIEAATESVGKILGKRGDRCEVLPIRGWDHFAPSPS